MIALTQNVFFIKTSAEVLSFRLFKEKSKRPIIKSISSISELKDFISKHLFERMIFYSQAHHIIDDNDKGADSVCKKIVSKLIL